jgi:hypothetical protein
MFRLWESRIPFLGQWTRIRRGHRQAGRVRRSRRWRRLHRGLGGECRRGQVAGLVANPVLATPGALVSAVARDSEKLDCLCHRKRGLYRQHGTRMSRTGSGGGGANRSVGGWCTILSGHETHEQAGEFKEW